MSDISAPQPLHTQIRDILREQVLNGHYQTHDKLPSEKQLMDRFGVSRITVRHALGALEQEGMVFKIAGKGCYVAKVKPAQQLAHLQGFAEAMNSKGYEACNRVLSIQTIAATPAVARCFAIQPASSMVEMRRVRYLDRIPVSVDVTYFHPDLGMRLAREDLVTRDIFLILENDYGIALGRADLSIEATVADTTLAAELDIQPGAALLALERLTFTREGEPLELDYIHYRGDRFRYQLSIERN